MEPLRPAVIDNNEILDISIEIDEPTLTESKKIEQDLQQIQELNDNQDGQQQLEERTEALTEEILTDFLHSELTSLKIARE
jgi:hypothetical protein